jgi:hypothetical protein
MIQVLGAFGPLDFSMLRPILAWRVLKLMNRLFTYFPIFLRAAVNCHTESVDTGAHLYFWSADVISLLDSPRPGSLS